MDTVATDSPVASVTPAAARASEHAHLWRRAFADLSREHGFEPLAVEGRLPAELRGTLVPTEPSLFSTFRGRARHGPQLRRARRPRDRARPVRADQLGARAAPGDAQAGRRHHDPRLHRLRAPPRLLRSAAAAAPAQAAARLRLVLGEPALAAGPGAGGVGGPVRCPGEGRRLTGPALLPVHLGARLG